MYLSVSIYISIIIPILGSARITPKNTENDSLVKKKKKLSESSVPYSDFDASYDTFRKMGQVFLYLLQHRVK